MAKIIGFTGNVDGFKTRAGFMNSTVFLTACETTVEKLKLTMAQVYTKRQAGKFRHGKGLVYDTAILKDATNK